MPDPKHPTCIDTSTIGEAPGTSWVCGPGCPRPAGPDPDRDARIDAYRDRERRRAARALDRYIEITFGPDHELRESWAVWGAAGERFVEAVGDYVLSRLQVPMAPSDLRGELFIGQQQHNGDYGVVDPRSHAGGNLLCVPCGGRCTVDAGLPADPCAGGRCPDPEAHAEGAHDL